MNLRELTPWLIPPLALLASALPHYNPAVSVASAPAALAATKPAPGTSRTQGVSTEGSSEQGHLDCYEHDARHLLWDFANANQLSSRENAELRLTLTGTGGAGQVSVDEDLKSDKAAPSRCPDNASDARLQRALRYFSVRFLIATLPDPGASNLQYDFDSGLEAMESAIAQSGYSIDRFDFPWNATAAPTSSTLAGTAKRNPASEPGLILFRKGDELLLLFIAGETPTSGIQKLAFTSALEQSAELSSFLRAARQNCIDNRDACPPAGVGLMTPFFTGSINSLTLALRSFRDWALDRTSDTGSSLPPLHVQIATGDATGIDLRNFDKDPFSNDSDSKPTTIVFDDPTFSATLGYNQEIRSAFLRFLHGTLNAGPREVAVLREANTGYGSSLAKMENVTLGDFVMFLIGQAHQNVSGAEGLLVKIQERMDRLSKGEPSRLEEILYGNFNDLQMEGDPEFVKFRDEYLDSFSFVDLPFPLHISAIRNASQPAVSSTPLAALLENPKTVFSVLTPQSQGTDVIPSFAEELDKPEAELVMSNLLSTLTSEKIHYVGIAATDVQDTIYLAREVHQNCPDVTVFAFTGNLLFLNSDVSEDLRGMLVVSTYPLVTLNQNLSYPWNGDSAHHQFSSDMTEGVFNATLALLGRGDQMLDYHPPFAPPLDTFDIGQPPVWIEAIGNNALIPIEIQPITPGLSTTYFYGSPNSVDAEGPEMPIVIPLDLSWAATLLFWATTLGCAAFAVSSFLPATSKRRGATWRPDLGHLNNPHAIFAARVHAQRCRVLSDSRRTLPEAVASRLYRLLPDDCVRSPAGPGWIAPAVRTGFLRHAHPPVWKHHDAAGAAHGFTRGARRALRGSYRRGALLLHSPAVLAPVNQCVAGL